MKRLMLVFSPVFRSWDCPTSVDLLFGMDGYEWLCWFMFFVISTIHGYTPLGGICFGMSLGLMIVAFSYG